MAQLSNDCFAFGGALTPIDEALTEIEGRVTAVTGTETIPLMEAMSRPLAHHVVAKTAVPPFANSAVDGYAVRYSDLDPDGDTVLELVGRAAAGHPLRVVPSPGTAVRIFTGAPMPAELDTVFMQEDARETATGKVTLPRGLKKGANARDPGEDVGVGDLLVPAGKRLTAADLALMAGQGLTEVAVRTPLRVAVMSTGDELAQPGDEAHSGQIFDSNRTMLIGLARGLGATVTDLGIIRDNADVISETLQHAARSHDAILTSGGMSTGEEDHLTASLRRAGSVHFWRLAIKPGRPVGLGQIGDCAVVGLPGNPAAAAVCFAVLGRPLLARLAGIVLPPLPRFQVEAAFGYRKKKQRREYVRVRLEDRAQEDPLAFKFPKEGAGLLTSIAHTQGFVELPEDLTQVIEGDKVPYIPFDALGLQ
ncbi:MAG: molybdopterin molybdotransferase MoeA [Alphaproteobacteria bacterium]|nr:molybdopterin molybdotransferase MoeA [Alphaproteobacteria bacterium]